ncbi:MAG: DinB family protein [Chitinophagales bacterium]
MSKIKSTALLEQAKVDTNTIIQTIKEEFQTLDENQLNWKSAPEKWNILQCLEHLNLTSRHYIPEMQKAVQKAIAAGQSPTEDFKHGFIGNKMTTGTRPSPNGKISNPIQTFKKYNPNNLAPSESTQIVFEEFLQHHQDLLAIIAQSAMVNMNKVKVKSLLGSILKFKLGDAIEFLIAHEQRHVLQAQKVLEKQRGG